MTVSGLKFPLQITALGRFAVVTEGEKIEQNMQMIVETALRERWYEPNVGTVGYNALFSNVTDENAVTIAKLAEEAIAAQEPRVVAQVAPAIVETLEGRITFNVRYLRKDVKTMHTMNLEIQNLVI